jgi:hypothetical protein
MVGSLQIGILSVLPALKAIHTQQVVTTFRPQS